MALKYALSADIMRTIIAGDMDKHEHSLVGE